MTKRMTNKAYVAAVFALAICLVAMLGITFASESPAAQAADVASYVTVNGQQLYPGQYLENNDATSKTSGAETEPENYVAWYSGGVLTLNNYNGDQISVGGNLTVKLKGSNTIVSSGNEGIFVSGGGNLIIDADSEATLAINVSSTDASTGTSAYNDICGIRVGSTGGELTGNLTIRGKSKVNIDCQATNFSVYGIYSREVTCIADEASLDVKCVSEKELTGDGDSYGIYSNGTPVFNTSGTIKIDTSGCKTASYCIYAVSFAFDMTNGDFLLKYKKEMSRSFALYPTIDNAPKGYVMRTSLKDGETVLKQGTARTVTVEYGTDYYEKKSNQYVEGETVSVKTSLDGLTFLGWEGEGVTFEDATQKETTFTMLDKDVSVKAVYDVFAKQPVFVRTGENKGYISVRLNKKISDSDYKPIVLINSTGEENSMQTFSLYESSEDFTYKCDDFYGSIYGVPAGKYRMRVNYDGAYDFYSEPFEIDYTDKTPNASISDVNVIGKRGVEIAPVSFDVTLSYATFKAIEADTDVSSWFSYIPGLVAKISAVSEGATRATITISGKPTTTASTTFVLKIPTKVLATGNDNAITTKYNGNARFYIDYPESYKVKITDGKAQVDGTTKTSVYEGSTVTIIADTAEEGSAFDKWVVVSGEVTLADANSATTTFVMPEGDVEIKATFKHVHSFTSVPERKATCAEAGMKAHSKCEFCGKLFDAEGNEKTEAELTIAIDSTAHDFATEWTKTSDGHYHVCNNVGCPVGHDEIKLHIPDRAAATDTDPVKCTACGYVIAPALGHTTHHLTLVAEVGATCTKEGTKAYYACDGCERKFKDEEGSEEITDDSTLVIPKAHKFGEWIDEVPATDEATGTKGHKDCEFCHKHFDEDGNEIVDVTLIKTYGVYSYWGTIQADGQSSTRTGSALASLNVKAGTVVTIIWKDVIDNSNKVFVKWTYRAVVDVAFKDVNSATTTFVMPKGDVWLDCEYKDGGEPAPKHDVKIEGGSSNETKFEPGQTVTITAGEAPEGKEFDKWIVVSGDVTLADANSASTTFVMPEGAVEIRATYKDKVSSGDDNPGGGDNPGGDDTPSGEIEPAKEGGLSGGAIAGIVIASVFAASIAGFAIFWFAIKKKTFADLGAAFKALFDKIKNSVKKK